MNFPAAPPFPPLAQVIEALSRLSIPARLSQTVHSQHFAMPPRMWQLHDCYGEMLASADTLVEMLAEIEGLTVQRKDSEIE